MASLGDVRDTVASVLPVCSWLRCRLLVTVSNISQVTASQGNLQISAKLARFEQLALRASFRRQ